MKLKSLNKFICFFSLFILFLPLKAEEQIDIWSQTTEESSSTNTEKDEKELLKQSEKAEKVVDERLLTAYKRIRKSSRNGLAVVSVERDSCGGCYSKIPPQRQLDIKAHKKIIVCEHCGRILIDSAMFETSQVQA